MNNTKGITIANFKLYCKYVAIRTAWYQHTSRTQTRRNIGEDVEKREPL
jgi:hypothetical protein